MVFLYEHAFILSRVSRGMLYCVGRYSYSVVAMSIRDTYSEQLVYVA